MIKTNKIDITQDYKGEWLKIGAALANEFNESGRNYFHIVSQYHAKYSVTDTDKMFDDVLKKTYSKISIGSFFKIASDYGIKLIKAGQERGEIARQGESYGNQSCFTKEHEKPKTLSDIGITRKESSTFIKPRPWLNEIAELENFFSSVKLPDNIKLDRCTTIIDTSLFIKSHLSIVKAQDGNQRYALFRQITIIKNNIKIQNLN